jgi:hypothetical protein
MFRWFKKRTQSTESVTKPKAATHRIPETTRTEFWKEVEFCVNSERVNGILGQYPALANDVRGDGSTPLHHAAAQGHTVLVNMLLSYGAKVNAQTNTNPPATPLDLALVQATKARTRGSHSPYHEDVIAILKNRGGKTKLG